jgi:hypothetical protein
MLIPGDAARPAGDAHTGFSHAVWVSSVQRRRRQLWPKRQHLVDFVEPKRVSFQLAHKVQANAGFSGQFNGDYGAAVCGAVW